MEIICISVGWDLMLVDDNPRHCVYLVAIVLWRSKRKTYPRRHTACPFGITLLFKGSRVRQILKRSQGGSLFLSVFSAASSFVRVSCGTSSAKFIKVTVVTET